MIIYANAHKDGADHFRPFGLFYSGTRRRKCTQKARTLRRSLHTAGERENKMSKKTNNKIKANTEVAETLAKAEVVPASIQAEPTRENWDRVITPKEGAPEAEKMDFERTDVVGAKITGVRYAKIDDNGRVMQIRAQTAYSTGMAVETHWWTVKDAIDAGVLGEDYAGFTGHFAEYDAKIARVELMEKLGIDVPNGVAMAYAEGVKAKKAAEAARAEREAEIVKGGRDAYCDKASTNAGKRFDKIADRVKAREGK